AGNYPEAKISIDDVRNLLDDPNVTKLPSISKRKNVELFFLDSLEKEILQAGVRDTTDFTSLTRAAEVLLAARQSVEYGTAAEAEGSRYDAKRFYNEALSMLPQIARAVDNMNAIDASDKTARSREYLLLANKAADGGQDNEAIKQYRAAAIGTVQDNLDIALTTALNGIERVLKQEQDDLEASTKKTITELSSELSKYEKTIDALSSNLETIESSNTELESEKNNLEEMVSGIDTREGELKNNIEALTSEMESSAKTIEQLNKKARESDETIAALTTEAKKTAFTIEILTKRAARAVDRAEILERELNDAVNQIVELIN
ncbi:MAG: hypothetical protein KAR21_16655, partial [Spirochaetales bacterium]|nr:hypothetical protein [Spirochaetales bacterium]